MLRFFTKRRDLPPNTQALAPVPVNTSIAALLPAELIIDILQHLDNEVLFRRYATLCAISTLCQTWSTQARILLWSKVVLSNERDARAFLKSRALGVYTTAYLSLAASGDRTSATTATAILSQVRGVEHLRLFDFGKRNGLDAKLLCSPNLVGLNTLQLQDAVLYRTPLSPSITIPPKLPLRRLEITFLHHSWANDHFSFGLVHAQCLSLTEFKLEFGYWTPYSHEIWRFLHRVAAQLKSLHLVVPMSITLLSTLEICTSLSDFTISCSSETDLISIAVALPCRLKSLTIRTSDFLLSNSDVMPSVLAIVDSPCLRELSTFCLHHYTQSQLLRTAEGEQVLEHLTGRGVMVTFGQEKLSSRGG